MRELCHLWAMFYVAYQNGDVQQNGPILSLWLFNNLEITVCDNWSAILRRLKPVLLILMTHSVQLLIYV